MGKKQYDGQMFVPTSSPEEMAEMAKAQAPYEAEDAVSIDVYFVLRSVRDPIMQASMRAFTKVRRATPSGWGLIFEKF